MSTGIEVCMQQQLSPSCLSVLSLIIKIQTHLDCLTIYLYLESWCSLSHDSPKQLVFKVGPPYSAMDHCPWCHCLLTTPPDGIFLYHIYWDLGIQFPNPTPALSHHYPWTSSITSVVIPGPSYCVSQQGCSSVGKDCSFIYQPPRHEIITQTLY